jgi:hypothetical protein
MRRTGSNESYVSSTSSLTPEEIENDNNDFYPRQSPSPESATQYVQSNGRTLTDNPRLENSLDFASSTNHSPPFNMYSITHFPSGVTTSISCPNDVILESWTSNSGSNSVTFKAKGTRPTSAQDASA